MTTRYRNETALQTAIRRKLEGLGWFVLKLHGSALKAGLPDLLALQAAPVPRCADVLWIETKMPAGKLRKIQEAQIKVLRRLGFEVLVARSVEEVLEVVA